MFARSKKHRGTTMIWLPAVLVAVTAFCSLGVDLARVQTAKTELQRTADAAARYAASGIPDSTWLAKAQAAAAQNNADGTVVTVLSSDVAKGQWNGSAFTANGTPTNAVKVTVYRTAARGTAVPTIWMGLLGRSSADVTASAIATYTAPVTTTITVPSNGDPWLAGMPAGTTANTYDAAPANSPAQITGIAMTPGAPLNFSFTGHASYYPGTQPFDPDGDPDWIIYNYTGDEHGIANLNSPLTAVVGIFLDDGQPDQEGAPPPSLDFTSDSSRDFASLSPALRQPFFIGNGLRADGVTKQDFIVPAGATRFYLGIMDGQQWSDNAGALVSTTVKPAFIQVVK